MPARRLDRRHRVSPVPCGPVPELIEVESYRQAAELALERPIRSVIAPDAWYLKGPITTPRALRASLTKRSFSGTRRIGKLLLLDLDDGGTLGLRFGMSGRLLVDGKPPPDLGDLLYSSVKDNTAWDRFTIRFVDGGDLRMRDPRRLGGVELNPDETRVGIDAAGVAIAQLRQVLAASRAPLKARLMDQSRLAGVGNLIADETLWRAGLDPARESRSLAAPEVRRLHTHLKRTITDLAARGGSHTGDFLPHRVPGGICPKDGTPLIRRTVGGRTTWSCPTHQT